MPKRKRVVRKKGSSQKRVPLGVVPAGRIVRVPDGRYAVTGMQGSEARRGSLRRLDFWDDGGDDLLPIDTLVDVLPEAELR